MSEENVQEVVPETAPVAEPTSEPQEVVVEGKPVAEEKKVDPALDPATSALPYHTEATEKIMAENAKDIPEDPDPADFTYNFNGYDVKAVKPEKGVRPGTDGFLYEVSSGDFKRTFMEKNDAVNYTQTHAPYVSTNKDVTVPVN